MKISFLASHGGSAAKHIIAAIRQKKLDAHIGIVITNNRNSDIYSWCQENAIEVAYLSAKTHPVEEDEDKAIQEALFSAGTDLIILSGYMKKIGPFTLAEYANKILNIHPSLLPAHGGTGLYGDRVHESVLKSADKQSGATVHFINKEYDEGPIIAQKIVPVDPSETVASLRVKVQAIEGELYLSSIKQIMRDNRIN